jgi:subtilisin family serine protease
LGYLEFDTGYPSYTWQDMDGNTALITRASDMAVARGIAVFNAAGNSGMPTGGRGNTLVAPADGDSVVTVGGTFPDGVRYFNSSVGPTANQPPRLKPDVMAQGAAVWIASAGGATHYGFSAGTSFACPLAAGVAALLLSVHPQATPLQIRDALRLTASNASSPDHFQGWGVVDAVAALDRLSGAVQPASWSQVKGKFR